VARRPGSPPSSRRGAADAGEQAPAEESVADRLEHVIEEEQAIVDELKQQGDQA
jgi:hypothetical protein